MTTEAKEADRVVATELLEGSEENEDKKAEGEEE
jgi:hypothetical protein